jgi:hypothetical protein
VGCRKRLTTGKAKLLIWCHAIKRIPLSDTQAGEERMGITEVCFGLSGDKGT